MINAWKISWRSLTRKKLRTLFTFLAITFGVAAILSVMSTVETTEKTVATFINSFNAKAHMQIKSVDTTFSYPFAKQIEETEGVLHTVAHLSQPARLHLDSLSAQPDTAKPNTKVVLHGYDRFDSGILDWQVEEGNLQNQGLIITTNIAEKWNVSIGQTIAFQVGDKRQEIAITAIVHKNDELPSPSNWDSTRVSRWHVAVPLTLLQSWAVMSNDVRDVQLRVEDGQGTIVAAKLEQLLKPYDDVYLDPIMLNDNELLYGLDDIFTGLYMLGALGMLMSAMILFSTLYVSVVERRREFAIMKTIGCTSEQVAAIVLREVLLLAVLGTAAGIAVGVGLAYGLTDLFMKMLDDAEQQVVSISWRAVALATAAGLIGSLLAAAIPLYQASKVRVSSGLSHSVVHTRGRRQYVVAAIGTALIGVGLWLTYSWRVFPLFAGLLLVFPMMMRSIQFIVFPMIRKLFGFEGMIASTGVTRQLRRMSIASAILCIGLSFLFVMGFLRDSLERSIEQSARFMVGGDIVLNTTIPLTERDLQKVRETDGINGVSAIRETSAMWRGELAVRKMSLIGVKEQSNESIPMFTSKEQPLKDIIALLQEPSTIALGHAIYLAWGGQVGEHIVLDTSTGRQTLRVVAIVNSIRESGNIAFVSDEQMEKQFAITDRVSMSILLAPGVSQETMKRQLVGQFGERLSGMRFVDEYLDNRKTDMIVPFTMMNILIALIVLVSGVGILNTLLMNVFERTREFGTMRAVASTPWQVRKMVVCEGVIIGVCSIVTAVVLGLALSYAMSVHQIVAGFSLPFFIPWKWMALSAGFGLFISLLSSWLPAVLASRIPLNEALRYE
ncbi:FtsX-like permease family protein [Paenibacillus sp. L3-i20]|uniref:FtsX-like permease family protein n=1 Tax=Paenibacillus sp. L3-i20 TaxID=2905833 RepID=UPI001EDD3DC1|nr:FtsX-like permease family protein [Paenibacillus sp. L3-i20]GKU78521.1 hypothetical protein L3i20_v229180 [Paenibacillus sp. L3-i20]